MQVKKTGLESSFRALSVIDDDVAWIGGSNGWVLVTVDGGLKWKSIRLPGHEESQFRSIYAFDQNRALVANAGSPAVILLTEDQGMTWKEVYRDDNPKAFLDGMDFWDEGKGLAYGDPKDGRMNLVRTSDGGRTWKEITDDNRPLLEEGEASFAASGTGIRTYANCRTVISTGGSLSRLFISDDCAEHWREVTALMLKGVESSGIFSSDFRDEKTAVVVGGDYLKPDSLLDHIFYTHDGGDNWHRPDMPTRGYRECVEHLGRGLWVAVGPSGMDYSVDNGEHWMPLSDEKGFHVIRKARKGELVIMAGSEGVIAIFDPRNLIE